VLGTSRGAVLVEVLAIFLSIFSEKSRNSYVRLSYATSIAFKIPEHIKHEEDKKGGERKRGGPVYSNNSD
jgi:hypothetical protein